MKLSECGPGDIVSVRAEVLSVAEYSCVMLFCSEDSPGIAWNVRSDITVTPIEVSMKCTRCAPYPGTQDTARFFEGAGMRCTRDRDHEGNHVFEWSE